MQNDYQNSADAIILLFLQIRNITILNRQWIHYSQLILAADIYGNKEPDIEALKAYLAEHCEAPLIPADIRFHEE